MGIGGSTDGNVTELSNVTVSTRCDDTKAEAAVEVKEAEKKKENIQARWFAESQQQIVDLLKRYTEQMKLVNELKRVMLNLHNEVRTLSVEVDGEPNHPKMKQLRDATKELDQVRHRFKLASTSAAHVKTSLQNLKNVRNSVVKSIDMSKRMNA